MNSHRLPNDREVSVVRLAMAHTYAGMMCGTPETASPGLLESLPQIAARMLSPAEPLRRTFAFDVFACVSTSAEASSTSGRPSGEATSPCPRVDGTAGCR
jgi:hypothetical protein